jgi:hypothetical protein
MARRASSYYVIDLTGRIVAVSRDYKTTNPNAEVYTSRTAANDALRLRLQLADDEELSYG